jgi:hypothetical protein
MWIGLFLLRTQFICRLLWSRQCLPLLPSGLFPSGFPTKILYAAFFSPICATCLAHRIPTVSYWCTIFSAQSSPLKKLLIWNIKLWRDGQNITSPWCCHFMQISFLLILFNDANYVRLYIPHIPRGLIWDQTHASSMRRPRLTTWTIAHLVSLS